MRSFPFKADGRARNRLSGRGSRRPVGLLASLLPPIMCKESKDRSPVKVEGQEVTPSFMYSRRSLVH